jgi:hypothetical protein
MFVFGIPLSFFLPLMVHVWAGLATVIIGIVAFRAPKRRGRHPRWGVCYLWAYTLVFLTATLLSGERWSGMGWRSVAMGPNDFARNRG